MVIRPHHIRSYLSLAAPIVPRRQLGSAQARTGGRNAVSDMSTGHHRDPGWNEFRLGDHLESRWAAWFDGMTLTHADDGSTVLTGSALDQAALHGVLRKVRDLGLPLIAVAQIDPRRSGSPTADRMSP